MIALKRLPGLVLSIALLALAAGAPVARAELSAEDITVQALNAAGDPEARAGAHPDRLVSTISFDTSLGENENVKEQVIELPAGFGGDPRAVPQCPRSTFDEENGVCPKDTQVGELTMEGSTSTEVLSVYSLEPGPNEAAVFGVGSFLRMKILGSLRPSDYGLSLALTNLPQGEPPVGRLRKVIFEFWGVPADHQQETSIPRRAFLTTPTRCGAPIMTTIRARTWEQPDRWTSASANTGVPLTGCQDLRFDPKLGLDLSNPKADSATGVGLDLVFPLNEDPAGRASAQAKDVSVALPEGMGVSPAAADGLSACTDAQFGAAAEAARCPASSRVGSVEMATAQLDEPLRGAIYLGQETVAERFRLFVLASGAGTEAKFVGSMRSDSATGQFTARLSSLPEVSFERLDMRFDGGPRALLVTPLSCGPARAVATFVPNSGTAPVQSTAAVTVARLGEARCEGAPPFAPSFAAWASKARAGAPTSFSTTVHRRDGEQLPGRFSVTLPAGLSAALGSADLCPEPGAVAGVCPLASRVGNAFVEVGSGPNPAALAGDVYLTGPYRRAPFGFALSFRAVIGPFDLGRFVVRSALRPDPLSGQITIDTDALPQSIGGLPIRLQTIGLDVDRPGFIRNPTSCTPKQVSATIRSTAGATSSASDGFESSGCLRLRFRPGLSIALSDRSELHEGGKPGLRISMRAPRGGGNANLRSAGFSLPRLLRFDGSGLREICARGEAAAGRCPKGARVGSAFARTPLLDGPLRGSVFLVQPRAAGSPDLWTSLEGSGLRVSLRGETAIEDGHVATRLVDLPDFPLSSFALRLAAGEGGIFALRKSPCAARPHLLVPLTLAGQNGARRSTSARLGTPADCGGDG